jgi:hypothetical protein
MKNILLCSIIFILVGCSSNAKNYDPPKAKSCYDLDRNYVDICRLFEIKTKKIIQLREEKKITHDQAELMIANTHSWAANESAKRFAQINGSHDYEPPSQYHDYNADADFYGSIAKDFKPHRTNAGALLSGFFEGMAHGANRKSRMQK